MLSKIQSTVILAITFAYGVFEVWNIVGAPPQDLVNAVVGAVFALLGFLWSSKKTYQAFKFNLDANKIERLAA